MAGALAGVLGLCLLAAILLTGDGGRASEAAAPAMLTMPRLSAAASVDTEIGEQVIPLGRAVGIKLFSDGVLVVGLSPVETERGAQYPGRDCGLKAGDVITHINGEEVDTIKAISI